MSGYVFTLEHNYRMIGTYTKKHTLVHALPKMFTPAELSYVRVYRYCDGHENNGGKPRCKSPIEVDVEYLLANPHKPCKERR